MTEFRIPEDRVGRLFEPQEGKSIGSVRVIRVDTSDPRYTAIGEVDREFTLRKNKPFFFGWHVYRRYSAEEFRSAKLFHLQITAAFEPVGEDCGTTYDESTACPDCGAGRTQVSDLRLDLRKAPKGKDIARTIADEWIVSQRLAELMTDAGLRGFQLRRVRHKARYEDDSIDPLTVASGRRLLAQAQKTGLDPKSWEFFIWLNRSEQKSLLDQAHQEHVALMNRKVKRRGKPPPLWYQLIVTSRRVPTVPPTKFGINPFDDDPEEAHVCPHGHVSGLNLLSEVSVARDEYEGADVICTQNMVGTRRGVLVPRALLLISPRFFNVLREHKINGYQADVAYLR